jgi:hypothetical protein
MVEREAITAKLEKSIFFMELYLTEEYFWEYLASALTWPLRPDPLSFPPVASHAFSWDASRNI